MEGITEKREGGKGKKWRKQSKKGRMEKRIDEKREEWRKGNMEGGKNGEEEK